MGSIIQKTYNKYYLYLLSIKNLSISKNSSAKFYQYINFSYYQYLIITG